MQYKLLYNDARLEIPLFGRYLPTYVPEQQLYTYKLTLYFYVNIITELSFLHFEKSAVERKYKIYIP